MYGKSWGGFNGLQITARALQLHDLEGGTYKGPNAVVSLYSTDDRYADDVHYVGGAVVGDQMLSWSR